MKTLFSGFKRWINPQTDEDMERTIDINLLIIFFNLGAWYGVMLVRILSNYAR